MRCPYSLSPLAASLCLIGSLALPTGGAQAQEVVPKLQAMCPLGYVDTFNGKCSPWGDSPIPWLPRAVRPAIRAG